MKIFILTIALTFTGLLSALADNHEETKAVFRHVVCFKFKKEATAEQITAIEKSFAELPSKIDAIKGYEWGPNVGDAAKAKGFTHCFILTFDDKAGLEIYIPHPDHQAFVKQVKPLLDDIFIVDYTTQ